VAVGLVLVAIGSGALKANASSLLGTLYEKEDARCDGGFTLFYLGIKRGAFVGQLITGLLQTRAGFHYGFGAAAIGMALGLAQYVAFRRNLGTHGPTVPNPLPRSAISWVIGVIVVAVVVIVVSFTTGLVKLSNLSQVTTGVIVAASVTYFVVMLTSSKVAAIERTRVRAFIPGKAVPALLVVGIMAVFAVSELLLSPIGLSVTTKLAPEAFRAQMMALYFFFVGLGTSMSGVLARYYDPAQEFAYFGIIGAVAIIAGVIVFAIAPWISRLMEGVH
jgi:dipeptide/tripeptide permease